MPDRLPQLVLASGSATRRQILAQAGLRFIVVPADIDEAAVKASLIAQGEDAPDTIAEALAVAKAQAVAARHPGALVLGADQVLALGGGLLSKAVSIEAARETLERLSGRRHALHSGVAFVRDATILWRHTDSAFLDMRRLTAQWIDSYLASGDSGILGSVGTYRIEGPGIRLFERVSGDYFTIMGLPLLAVLAELRRQGVDV